MNRTLWTLAWEGVRRKKHSSILVFLVLLVSFCFLIISLAVAGSISQTSDDLCRIIYGDWDAAIIDGRQEDAAFLAEKQQAGLIETLGRMDNYGTIRAADAAAGFGTLDDAMIQVGRLTLEQGRWPEAQNEIAMEAQMLDALGYSAQVGQTVQLEITLQDGQTLEQTFTLCGIIREYSGLWLFNYNKNGTVPVSAVVTSETAQAVLELADGAPDPFPQYFAAAPEGKRLQLEGQLDAYLKQTRNEDTENIKACSNPGAAQAVGQVQYDSYFFGLIAGVTMLAILCVYLLHLPAEQHRFAILRSIGATRRQLARLIAAETLLLALPAMLLAIPCGALGTKLALGLLVFSDSVPVAVSIPWGQLMLAALLWALAILAARFILFAVVARMPLTGRFALKTRTARRLRLLRGGMAAALLALFGVTVIFCSLQVLRQQDALEASSDQPYYSVQVSIPSGEFTAEEMDAILEQSYQSKDKMEFLFGTVSQQDKAFFEAIPGAQKVYTFTNLMAGLSFDGMEERTVRLIGLDAGIWDKVFDFGPDQEAFEKGELVLVCLPGEDVPDWLLFDADKEPDQRIYLKPEEDLSSRDYLKPNGDVTLHFYNNDDLLLGDDTVAAAVRTISYETLFRYNGLMRTNYYDSYSVICSDAYLEKILAELPAGQKLGPLVTGEALGYSHLYIRLETYANPTVADNVISTYCRNQGLDMDNQRQTQAARDIQGQQQMIMLIAAGSAVALMLLLILVGVLSLESEQEKRSFSLLRRIGMSAAQQRGRVLGKVAARGLLAAVSGWVLFFLIMIMQFMVSAATPMPEIGREAQFITPWQALMKALDSLQKQESISGPLIAALTLVCLVVPLLVLLLGKARLLKGKVEV